MSAYPLSHRPADLVAPRSIFLTVSGTQTTGTVKGAARFTMPCRGKVVKVQSTLGTANTGATFLVDVNIDGTTIFTTQGNRPSIAISGTESTLGVPDADDACEFESGETLTVDVDQIGSTVAGDDLTVRIDWIPV